MVWQDYVAVVRFNGREWFPVDWVEVGKVGYRLARAVEVRVGTPYYHAEWKAEDGTHSVDVQTAEVREENGLRIFDLGPERIPPSPHWFL